MDRVQEKCCFFASISSFVFLDIDSGAKANLEGLEQVLSSKEDSHLRKLADEDLERLWTQNECVSVLPCLSVRSGIDLYFSVSKRHF